MTTTTTREKTPMPGPDDLVWPVHGGTWVVVDHDVPPADRRALAGDEPVQRPTVRPRKPAGTGRWSAVRAWAEAQHAPDPDEDTDEDSKPETQLLSVPAGIRLLRGGRSDGTVTFDLNLRVIQVLTAVVAVLITWVALALFSGIIVGGLPQPAAVRSVPVPPLPLLVVLVPIVGASLYLRRRADAADRRTLALRTRWDGAWLQTDDPALVRTALRARVGAYAAATWTPDNI